MSLKKQLRVLHIGPDRGARGGIASLLCAMGESAASFGDRGISLQFISTTRSDNKRMLVKIGVFFRAIGDVLNAILKAEVDIVHIHTALKGSLIRKAIFAWICYLAGVPYIFQVHNGAFFDRYLIAKGLNRLFVRLVLRNSARVVVISQYMRNLGLQTGAVSADQCILIYNGIDDPLRGEIPGKEWHASRVKIVFLGLLSVAKGIPTLLDAIKILAPDFGKFSVSIYGSGDVSSFERNLVDRGLSDVVTYGGWIGGERKDSILNEADIFVLPSRNEGFSVAILEAMAHGLAIVSTSIPGVVDAVRSGVEAILVPPDNEMALADAILALIDDPELRLQFGQAARQRYMAHFTLEKMADELSFVYRECVKRVEI